MKCKLYVILTKKKIRKRINIQSCTVPLLLKGESLTSIMHSTNCSQLKINGVPVNSTYKMAHRKNSVDITVSCKNAGTKDGRQT